MNPAARTALRLVVSLGLAAALLWALAAWGGARPADLADALGRLPLATFATALGIHAAIYVLRSRRFAVLVPPAHRPGSLVTLACSAAHNLAAYVLPAKTGEASLVLYLRSRAGVPGPEGLASLLVSRLLDLAVLCVGVGLASLALAPDLAAAHAAVLRPLAVAVLAAGALLLAACLRPDLLARVGGRALRAGGLGRLRLGRAVLDRVDRVAGALRASGAGGALWRALGLTVGIWALVFLFYAVLARGVGLGADLTYLEATFGSALAVLFNLLPINGFAGFGTQEAGWQVGFELLGVAPALALSTGVAVHLVQLFDVVLFGVLGHLAMGLLPARGRPADAA